MFIAIRYINTNPKLMLGIYVIIIQTKHLYTYDLIIKMLSMS
jgi:hypothetical protein